MSPPSGRRRASVRRYRRSRAALSATRRWRGALPRKRYPSRRDHRPGETYAGAAALARRLVLLGGVPADAARTADPDVYGGALSKGSNAFSAGTDWTRTAGWTGHRQAARRPARRPRPAAPALARALALAADGVLAAPIIVMISDFRLRARMRRASSPWRCVSSSARRRRPDTGLLAGHDLRRVRPNWNVPPGSRRRECPPYGATVTTRRTARPVTTPTARSSPTADFRRLLPQLKAGRLAVRQKPGPANALGLVKLIFPNEFNVYLHSTPSVTLFAKSRRDFSHGCIRVEKPAELAAWALPLDPDSTLDPLGEAVQTGPGSVTVKLDRPVPVFIVYATALAYPNGEVHFYDDVYGHDADLAPPGEGLTRPGSLRQPSPGIHRHGRVRRRRARVGRDMIPDSAATQTQRRIAKLRGRHARHADVDCHRLHVHALPRDAVPALPEETRSWPACDNRRSPGSRRRAARGKPADRGADPEGAGRMRGRRPCASRAGLDRPGSARRDRSRPRAGTRRRDALRCGDGGNAGGTALPPRAPRPETAGAGAISTTVRPTSTRKRRSAVERSNRKGITPNRRMAAHGSERAPVEPTREVSTAPVPGESARSATKKGAMTPMPEARPPLPPFTREIRDAEDASRGRRLKLPRPGAASRSPTRRTAGGATGPRLLSGGETIAEFLRRSGPRGSTPRLIKELRAFHENRIAVGLASWVWHREVDRSTCRRGAPSSFEEVEPDIQTGWCAARKPEGVGQGLRGDAGDTSSSCPRRPGTPPAPAPAQTGSFRTLAIRPDVLDRLRIAGIHRQPVSGRRDSYIVAGSHRWWWRA